VVHDPSAGQTFKVDLIPYAQAVRQALQGTRSGGGE
jgi:hypothetical protein